MNKPEFLYIESCNFIDYPVGGTLSFSRQMLKAFGNRMGLVGISTDDTPINKWLIKEIEGEQYYFYSIGRYKKDAGKPFIPARLKTLIQLIINGRKIRQLKVERVFTRTPQFAIGLSYKHKDSNCFCFAGTSNSVAISKYKGLRFLHGAYEKILFLSLQRKFNIILASADNISIKETQSRAGSLLKTRIQSFPTRFDPKIFFPKENKELLRMNLGFAPTENILVVVGKLTEVKGWELIIDSFRIVLETKSNSRLVFIGEGEDRLKIERYVADLIECKKVLLLGRKSQEQLNDYLNIANIVLVGSYHEGWSNSMIEAIGTATIMISTDVSGARELIHDSKNGYICPVREPSKYAELIIKALYMDDSANQYSLNLSKKYTINTLSKDLESIWLKA